MERNYGLDMAKCLCMIWVIGILHLSQYLGNEYYLWYTIIGCNITYAALGTFSLIGGLLIGSRYTLNTFNNVCVFYKKRILRFYPLFIIATILLCIIHLNDIESSIAGLLGYSSFITKQPMTLWYISMMLIFYLITPLILNKHKYISGLLLLVLFCVYKIIFVLDIRFIYNISLYILGLIVADKINFTINTLRNKQVCFTMVLIYSLGLIFLHLNEINSLPSIVFSYCGVIAIFSISVVIEQYIKTKKIISLLSYISLSFYLFHRFTYWLLLAIWHPDNIYILTLYLVLVAFPLGAVFAYLMQKMYDAVNSKLGSTIV